MNKVPFKNLVAFYRELLRIVTAKNVAMEEVESLLQLHRGMRHCAGPALLTERTIYNARESYQNMNGSEHFQKLAAVVFEELAPYMRNKNVGELVQDWTTPGSYNTAFIQITNIKRISVGRGPQAIFTIATSEEHKLLGLLGVDSTIKKSFVSYGPKMTKGKS